MSQVRRFISCLAFVGLILPLLSLSSCTQSHPAYTVNPAAPLVRVCLLEKQRKVMLSATEPPLIRIGKESPGRRLDIPAGSSVAIQLTRSGTRQMWQIGNIPLDAGVLTIVPATDGSVSINGKSYHGKYRLVPLAADDGGGFDVINDVDIDSYLKGVLADELLKGWLLETYKAQAITSRTYALYVARTTPPGKPFDLYADQRSQVYGGISAETTKSRRAVDETAGVVLAYGPPGHEKIFKAYFSSCCGGITQSAADAFGDPYIPPLSAQDNHSLCSASPKFNWGPVAISKSELTSRIRAWGAARNRPEKQMAELSRIDIQAVNRWGRPTRFMITDAAGNRYSLSGEELRWAINTNATDGTKLYSSFFKLINDPDVVRFVDCHGNGHGVGLCQWGAEARAEAGMRHEDIVLAAFPRAVLVRAY